jgi:amino acid transporter
MFLLAPGISSVAGLCHEARGLTMPCLSANRKERRILAEPDVPNVARDWRAVIVAGMGVLGIAIVVFFGLKYLPGPIPENETDNTSGAVGGIVGAAVAAIGTVVSAYFGIRAANVAREETQKAGERANVRLAEVSGAGNSEEVSAALARADETIKSSGLG